MTFLFKKNLDSTQIFLQNIFKTNQNLNNDNLIIVSARSQHAGIGSRNNSWMSVERALYLSFAINKDLLPFDLPLQSSSIYFGQILLNIFSSFNNKLVLKWPNDFYLDSKKVGGLMSSVVGQYLIIGVGLNIYSKNLASLTTDKEQGDEIFIQLHRAIFRFFEFSTSEDAHFNFIKDFEIYDNKEFFKFRDELSWNDIFQAFSVEFYKNRNFMAHIKNKKVNFKYALLNNDGSITINNETFYSLR